VARELIVSIDAMGGDAGPGIVITALLRVSQRHPAVRFILVGDEAVLNDLLARHAKLRERVTVRHAPERVSMEDKPSHVLRRGQNTSMWKAIECVKNKEAEVAVSAGNTGALMAMSMFQLRTLENISRPAIASIWPTLRGQSVVLDCGANVGATAEQLVEFAIMGEAFAHAILGLEKPTVGILNVGTEEQKGNDGVKEAANILRHSNLPLAFHGFIEGNDIAEGTVDVVVTDGFTGNIALKTAEGTAKGGIFLGLGGMVVKSHGGTDATGFAAALDMAISMARADINTRIIADRARLTLAQEAPAQVPQP